MKFTVTWIAESEAELAKAWIASDDRVALTAACERVESLLAEFPLLMGESRNEDSTGWYSSAR